MLGGVCQSSLITVRSALTNSFRSISQQSGEEIGRLERKASDWSDGSQCREYKSSKTSTSKGNWPVVSLPEHLAISALVQHRLMRPKKMRETESAVSKVVVAWGVASS